MRAPCRSAARTRTNSAHRPATATGAVSVARSEPPRPGPTSIAVASGGAQPGTRPRVSAVSGTTSGRCAPNAGRKMTRATPTTSSTAISWVTVSAPRQPGQRHGQQRRRGNEVGGDEQRAAPWQAVDPGADDEREPDVRRGTGRDEQAHLHPRRSQQHRGRQRDREHRDLAADSRARSRPTRAAGSHGRATGSGRGAACRYARRPADRGRSPFDAAEPGEVRSARSARQAARRGGFGWSGWLSGWSDRPGQLGPASVSSVSSVRLGQLAGHLAARRSRRLVHRV